MCFNVSSGAGWRELVPPGLVATRSWLMRCGMRRHRLDNLVKSRRLAAPATGVYALPSTRLVWQGAVRSLQRMGGGAVVGGLTALELQGRAHYLPLSPRRRLDLCGPEPAPRWMNRLGLDETFRSRRTPWLRQSGEPEREAPFSVQLPWGDGVSTIGVSTLERALFEVLKGVPGETSFEHAELLMEGLVDLSPRRLDALLRRTRSVKIKRLFFWLAGRQGHLWAERLDVRDYDLGRGKRVLARGGRLVREFGFTVPDAMHGQE